VEITALVPPELRAIRATGLADGRIDVNGKISFPPIDELRPKQTLAYTVDVEALQTGDARFKAEVKAAHLKQPLQEEQATRVTAR
jgi:hypothetical protein